MKLLIGIDLQIKVQNKMKQILFLLILGASTLFISCEEESIAPEPVDLQADFFPLSVGNTWIYKSDSIVYNKQLNTSDTLQGFVREVITDAFELSDGSTNYVIERSFKRLQEHSWNNTDIYSASLIDNKATRNEENLRFVKLLLPPAAGQEWDGNQFFDEATLVNVNGEFIEVFKNWSSQITSIGASVTVNGVEYNNTIEVLLVDTENSIEKRFAKEVYAKGVGLIQKEMIIIDSQDVDSGLPITERPEKGFTLQQTLIESF